MTPVLLASIAAPSKGEPPAHRPIDSREARPAAEGPGLKVLVDPSTGRFVSPAHGQEPAPKGPGTASSDRATAPAASSRLATSHEGLVAVRGTSRAGGLRVDLQGRFQSAVVATVGPDGKLTTACVAAAGEKEPGRGKD